MFYIILRSLFVIRLYSNLSFLYQATYFTC